MENNKQQTAVDSIIEFCQKQMDNDSSIHKGVYLSIIKFCKEQITEESEIHWKTTLVTMTNNKQQTAVKLYTEEQIFKYLLEHGTIDLDSFMLNISPIELPSDEEIQRKIEYRIDKEFKVGSLAFRDGAKWMRDKIKGGKQ
jgi:hypothetical protein